jgi:hypothetical protein
LKRLRLAIVVSLITVPSRTTRTFAPRVTFPSVTKQPAIVPMRDARKVWRTSTWPTVSSTSSGSSMPCIAARSSSIAR